MHKFVYCAFLSLICTACFDPGYMLYKSNFRSLVLKDTIVIEETSLHLDGGLIIGVYMMPEEARKIGAPNSVEFIRLVDIRVSQREQLIGHKICPHGYKMSNKPPFTSEYGIWVVDFYCNSDF